MAAKGGHQYRICVVGFAHMHVNDLVDRFLETGRVELVACADTIPRTASLTCVEGSRRANLKRTLRAATQARTYDDYRDMLRNESLDLAVCCPEMSQHAEVVEEVAAHGLHVVIEKPMAGSLADAMRMVRATEAAGVRIAVDWPTTWRPAIRKVGELLSVKEIGDVWEFKWRNRASLGPLAAGSLHPGDTVISGHVTDCEKGAEWWHQAAAGGGALLDYCCYGACLASWYLGAKAISVQGFRANLFSPFGDADDNAVLLLQFPSAIGIIEASWTTLHGGVPNGPIIYGAHGTIVVDGQNVMLYKSRDASIPTRVFNCDKLPDGRATIAEEFLRHIETGAALHPTLAIPLNLATVAILDAGIQSAASGRSETVQSTP
jgi:predicted dehydrogenase